MKKVVKLCLLVLCLFLSACGKEQNEDKDIIQVYFVSNSETKVEMHPMEMTRKDSESRLQELLTYLSTQPEKLEYKVPLNMGFQVLDTSLKEGKLLINVDSSYTELPVTTEILVRAALVRTLTQLENVNYVGISVAGDQLFDSFGNPVGWMSADQFIDNDGNEINTYELAKIKLYFADEEGTGLIAAFREKHYSTNTPLERFVVEELIQGPSGQVAGLYPTINPDTKIIGVMTKDGVCYVNLDDTFLTVVNNVSIELAIYSIVNSLAELNNINKVQILINGEVPASFTTPMFERNLDVVTTLE